MLKRKILFDFGWLKKGRIRFEIIVGILKYFIQLGRLLSIVLRKEKFLKSFTDVIRLQNAPSKGGERYTNFKRQFKTIMSQYLLKEKLIASSPRLCFVTSIIFLSLLFQSCQFFEKEPDPIYHYFFSGHCYEWDAPNWGQTDYRLHHIGLDTFDQIWLGGDVVENMFHHPDNIEFVDTFYRVGEPTTLWAIGNHDVLDQQGDFSGIEKRTGRKTFYTIHSNGLTLLILNTTEFSDPNYFQKPHECDLLKGQLDLIKAVTDTIQKSSHLVVLHHHALLNNAMTNNEIDVQKIFNFYAPFYNVGCKERGTFEEVMYPHFLKVQKRGVQVVFVGGDTGQQVKEFEYTTKDGVIFLGSGLNNSAGTVGRPPYFSPEQDQYLVFIHRPKKRKLEWEFRKLEPIPSKEN